MRRWEHEERMAPDTGRGTRRPVAPTVSASPECSMRWEGCQEVGRMGRCHAGAHRAECAAGNTRKGWPGHRARHPEASRADGFGVARVLQEVGRMGRWRGSEVLT